MQDITCKCNIIFVALGILYEKKERKFKTNCWCLWVYDSLFNAAQAIIYAPLDYLLVHEAQSFLDRRTIRTCLIFWSAVWVFKLVLFSSYEFFFFRFVFIFIIFSLYSFQCWIINSLLFCSIGIHEGASFKSWMLTWCNLKKKIKKTKAFAQKRLHIKIIFFKKKIILFVVEVTIKKKYNSIHTLTHSE